MRINVNFDEAKTCSSGPASKHMKKGMWSPDEDARLKKYIESHGIKSWSIVALEAGLQRCAKSCRLRWLNYLSPQLKHGNFSIQEQELIFRLHSSLGNRWSSIAKQLPGRTDNEIKNFWNVHFKRSLKIQSSGNSKKWSDLDTLPNKRECSESYMPSCGEELRFNRRTPVFSSWWSDPDPGLNVKNAPETHEQYGHRHEQHGDSFALLQEQLQDSTYGSSDSFCSKSLSSDSCEHSNANFFQWYDDLVEDVDWSEL